jgi:hypothetical protein
VERPDESSISNRVVWLLLGYLYSHPDAKDTAEGITNWWLRARGVQVDGVSVEDALHELVISGWLRVAERIASHPIYSFDQARSRDLQRLFESTK